MGVNKSKKERSEKSLKEKCKNCKCSKCSKLKKEKKMTLISDELITEFPNFKDDVEAEFVDFIFNISESDVLKIANTYLDLGITFDEVDCVDINGVTTDLMVYLNRDEKEGIIKTYNYYQKF